VKLLICGDRNWTDGDFIYNALKHLGSDAVELVIEGEARGADALARHAAERLGIPVKGVKAQWTIFGRAAGPIRNRSMLALSPDLVWAFHDDITHSKGTRDMVLAARKAGIEVVVFTHPEGWNPPEPEVYRGL